MMRRDGWLLCAVVALALFGLRVQLRMSTAVPGASFFLPIIIGGVCGLAAMLLCTGERVGVLLRGKWIAFGLAAALMAALIVFGRRYRGGLYLPGRLNPSELVKLCMVVFCAASLSTRKDGVFGDLRDLAFFAGALGLLAVEIAVAGDFGLLAQIALTVAAMLFAASWLWGTAAFGIIAGGVWFALAHPMGHLATRIAVWRDPLADATGAGWQTLQGVAAVVHGGVSGTGLGLGGVQAIPIVSSDFVYAALAEELGLLGCLAVLTAYAVVFARGLLAAGRQTDRGAALLATGIVASVSVQVLLNVAGVLNALPMTGITLPLVSHGGSSLVVTLILLGMLLGLTRRGK